MNINSYSNREGYLFKVGGSIGSRKASLLCDWVFREFESGATKVNGTFGLELPLSNQRSTLIQIYSTVNLIYFQLYIFSNHS